MPHHIIADNISLEGLARRTGYYPPANNQQSFLYPNFGEAPSIPMANNNPTIWPADPHTVAKIEILKNYLNAWFPIIGSQFDEVTYVDGFAGPGSYTNHLEGSPIAALNVFKAWISKDPDRLSISKVNTVFIEADLRRFELLKYKINEGFLPARIKSYAMHGKFEEVVEKLFSFPEFASSFFGKQPLLIFADPFGGTGIPFSLLKKCLASSGSELLLNFDADGISRIYSGKNVGWQTQLDGVFGCREWENMLRDPHESLVKKSEKCLELYKQQLLEIDGVNFVWPFEMRGKNDRINYYLVFATRNRLGMEKMKEAMKAIDISGQYCFSDAHYNQHFLFRADDVEFFAPLLHKLYLGRSATYDELVRHALCETPFVNPKSMLEWLSRRSQIEVTPRPGVTVRAHSFPEERIETIAFVQPRPREVQPTLF